MSESQAGLENITLDEEGGNSTKKNTRRRFTVQEVKILIESWLNISKDPVVGNDQSANGFWERIKDNYNSYRGGFSTRETIHLKSRWFRINPAVQKFVGCYKDAIQQKKSGSSEKDIMTDAYLIFTNDTGKKFEFEHAWRLLRDELKWKMQSMENCSKRTKVSTSGAYSSSSNIEMPIDCSEYNPTVPLARLMGQKAAKRKSKGKGVETSSNKVDLSSMEDALNKKNLVAEKIVEAKQTENIAKLYEILIKNTDNMSETQLKDHEMYCAFIRNMVGNIGK